MYMSAVVMWMRCSDVIVNEIKSETISNIVDVGGVTRWRGGRRTTPGDTIHAGRWRPNEIYFFVAEFTKNTVETMSEGVEVVVTRR